MKKLFIIGYVWPEPTASAAGIRMLQLIRFFSEHNYQVHFGTPAQETPDRFDLSKMGVVVHSISVNDDGFNELIGKLNPHVVLFDRFMMEEQFAWRVAEHCPSALRVLDTEDLHFLRKFRQVNRGEVSDDLSALLQDKTAKREIAAIYRSDLTLVISEFEMELLKKVFGVPDRLLIYHPVFCEDSLREKRSRFPTYAQRADVMIIGNFLHAPNADAVSVLADGLWEGIRNGLPDVRLHIFGAYMPEEKKQRSSLDKGIIYHGRAADVNVVMQEMRLCIAPLRFGAGLKGKLIKAMENGLPTVTTPLGAEGISGDYPWAGEIASLETPFTEAVINLYKDESRWNKAVERGYTIIDQRFLRGPFEQKLDGVLNALMLDLQGHRDKNFTGQMLLDQRSMASKYLSKYIIAKNKNNH